MKVPYFADTLKTITGISVYSTVVCYTCVFAYEHVNNEYVSAISF